MNQAKIIQLPEGRKKLQFHSDDEIEFICGESKITMYPDGKIIIKGSSIKEIADRIEISGKRIDIE